MSKKESQKAQHSRLETDGGSSTGFPAQTSPADVEKKSDNGDKATENSLSNSFICDAELQAEAVDHGARAELQGLIDTAIHRQLSHPELQRLRILKVQEYSQLIDALTELYPNHTSVNVTSGIFERSIAPYVRAKFEREAKQLADVFHATRAEISAWWPEIFRVTSEPTSSLPVGFSYVSTHLIASPPGWASLLADAWSGIRSYVDHKLRHLHTVGQKEREAAEVVHHPTAEAIKIEPTYQLRVGQIFPGDSKVQAASLTLLLSPNRRAQKQSTAETNLFQLFEPPREKTTVGFLHNADGGPEGFVSMPVTFALSQQGEKLSGSAESNHKMYPLLNGTIVGTVI